MSDSDPLLTEGSGTMSRLSISDDVVAEDKNTVISQDLHDSLAFEMTPEFPRQGQNDNGVAYRTYKLRWFGLIQLTLMNIVVSWGWLTFAPVAGKAATYYSVHLSTINWLSTVFFLAFLAFPLAILALNRSVKLALSIAATLILIGNWIRYAGATSTSGGNMGCAMAGQILIGIAQPFILAAPTRYSDLWFTNSGRVTATAVMSLANPLGGALAQLINPFWVTNPGDISRMMLYVSIISTMCSVPAFFVPAKPPTPVGPSSTTPKTRLRESLSVVFRSPEVICLIFPFAVYVGFFNSFSSLLNQMMTPYGFSDDQAGIVGAILIIVGIVTAAITSPILDRTKKFLLAIRILAPLVGVSFLVFTWMPETRSVVGPFIVVAFLGASAFALVPVVLEFLIELSHPVSPEVTSTIAWTGGQFFGAIFIIISGSLVADDNANPPNNMKAALVFQGVVALVVVALPLSLGLFGRKDKVTLRRIESDRRSVVAYEP